MPIFDRSPAATIAVFPFENLSEDVEQGYVARGFVDEITNHLSRFAALAVIHPRSVAELAAGRESVPQLDYRVHGSVRRDSGNVFVTAQLEDASSGRQLWARRYDAPMDDALTIQDEIAASVAATLAIKIDSARLDAARRKPAASLEAYDCWLRGMDHLRRGSAADDASARELFQRALRIDPHYARAHAGISLSHFNDWSCQSWQRWDQNEQLAWHSARTAWELGDADAMIHIVLARIHLYRREFSECSRHLDRALELNPNDADALAQGGLCRAYLGDARSAIELTSRAMQLNPFHDDWYLGCAALARFAARDYDEGLDAAVKAPRATVDLPAYIACGYARRGDSKRAGEYLEMFLDELRNKVTFGREPEPGEPLRWLLHVNPFRRREDSEFLAEGLRLAGLASDPDAEVRAEPTPRAEADASATFRRDGDTWTMSFAGHEVRLAEVKGFHDLVLLLTAPGRELHCLELAGRPAEGGDEVLDARARDEIAARIRELQAELDDADAANDLGRSSAAARELDALVEGLSKALGLGGRARTAGSAAERARSAVTWRIRNAIKKIQASHPRLGRHLDNAVKTGTYCCYSPESAIDWQL